jgi:hypothetical protein
VELRRVSENGRWCESHGYFIALEACQARAAKRPRCRRCLLMWRQMPLPFLEDIGPAGGALPIGKGKRRAPDAH